MLSYGTKESVVDKVIQDARRNGEPVHWEYGSSKHMLDLMEWMENMRPVYQSFPFRVSISEFDPFNCQLVFENSRHSINEKTLTLEESEVLSRFIREIMHINSMGWEYAHIATWYPTPTLMNFIANLIIKYNPDDLLKSFKKDDSTNTAEWWQSLKQQIVKKCNIPRLEYMIEQMHLPEVDVESVVSSRDIGGLIEALDYTIFEVKENIMKTLVEIGKPAVQPLLLALKDNRCNLREAAVEALGKIKEPVSIEPLVQLLEDDDSHVRFSAEHSLRDFKELAVPFLLQALNSDNSTLRGQAANVLGHTKDSRATAPLCRMLRSRHKEERESAAEALKRIKDPLAVDPLIKGLKDRDYRVRWESIRALGEIGDARALTPLINRLRSDNKYERQFAGESIINIFRKTMAEEIAEPFIQKLVTMLRDDYQWSYASWILSAVDYPITDFLIRVLRSDEKWHIRKRIPMIISTKAARHDDQRKRVLDALCQALEDKDKEVKISAAFALEKLRDPSSVQALTRALNDKDIRFAAELALRKIPHNEG